MPHDSLLEHFLSVAKTIPIMVEAYDKNDVLIFWNEMAELISGYSAKELLGNPKALEIMYPQCKNNRIIKRLRANRGSNMEPFFWELTCKGGEKRTIAWFNVSQHVNIPAWHKWAVGVDMTDRMQLEEEIKHQQRELIRQIQKTTETRVALRVLLEQLEIENKRVEQSLCYNLELKVSPFLEKLSRTRLDSHQRSLLNMATENIKGLKASIGLEQYIAEIPLTPMEMEVAIMIEGGKSTNEIANMLNLAEATINTHRHNIRRKLKLIGGKVNLKAELKRRFHGKDRRSIGKIKHNN